MSFQYAIRRNSQIEEQRDRELEDYLAQCVVSSDIRQIVTISAVDYAALAPPDPETLYVVI